MKLKKLEIELVAWGEKKGQYIGLARFLGDAGDVDLKLGNEHCLRIFDICAEGLVDVARDAAKMLTSEVIECQAKRIGK